MEAPRPQTGAVKRGLGIGVNAWGGNGHASNCRTMINPDGSVSARDRHAGSRHRHPHHHHPGRGRDSRPADGPDQAGHRQQQPAPGRRLRRLHHRRRRFRLHPQSRASTRWPNCSKPRRPRSARSPTNWKPSMATSASRAAPTRASPGQPPARSSAPAARSPKWAHNEPRNPRASTPAARRACRSPTSPSIPKPASSR